MFVSINDTGLKLIANRLKTSESLRSSLTPFFLQASTDLHERVVDEAPKKLGKLQDSIKLDIDGFTAEIGCDDSLCPYAKYVYGGTRKHVIKAPGASRAGGLMKPMKKSFTNSHGTTYKRKVFPHLRFQGFNGFVFARQVTIPAKAPNPFLLNSYENHKKEFIDDIKSGFKQIIEGTV